MGSWSRINGRLRFDFWCWFGSNRNLWLWQWSLLWCFRLLWMARILLREFRHVIWVELRVRCWNVEVVNDTLVKVDLEDHLANCVGHPA